MTNYNDYIGFTIDNIHSSELGIVRVSNSNRYADIALPTFQDRTVQVGGRNGTYLFGSNFQKREFSIPFAFDGLNETQVHKIQSIFVDNKFHKLIFDEWPYKYYNVKLASPTEFKYLVFDEFNSKNCENKDYRVYKGEGTFKFICYECFGRGTVKSTEEIEVGPIYSVYYTSPIKEEGSFKEYLIDGYYDEINLIFSQDWLYDRINHYKSLDTNFKENDEIMFQDKNTKKELPTPPYPLKLFELNTKNYEYDESTGLYSVTFNLLTDFDNDNNIMFAKQIVTDLIYLEIYKKEGSSYLKIGTSKSFKGYIEGMDRSNEAIHFRITLDINEGNIEQEKIEYSGNRSFRNLKEWLDIDGRLLLPKTVTTEIESNSESQNNISIYNPGDFPMPFKIFIPGGTNNEFSLSIDGKSIKVKNFTLVSGDDGIVYDSDFNILRGYRNSGESQKIITNNIYNQYITEGDFFKISAQGSAEMEIKGTLITGSEKISTIEYEYRYI